MSKSGSVRRFQRRRWDIAWITCICAALAILIASEVGYRERARIDEQGVQSIGIGMRLQELAARLTEAELGERMFLLTSKEEYLQRYARAASAARQMLDQLRLAYLARSDTSAEPLYAALVAGVLGRLETMDSALGGSEAWSASQELGVLGETARRDALNENLALIDHLAVREAAAAYDASYASRQGFNASRLSIAGAALLTAVLLMLLFGALRRDRHCAQERQLMLDQLVRRRTQQLGTLASSLQEASEAEKAAMARELHDELGALLTASKMELAWARRQLGPAQASIAAKLDDVANLLDQGLLAKRRIVEGLRPSTLDHFGVCIAAKDLCEQMARRAGWRLTLDLPPVDPALDSDSEIVLYRVLQESLTNATKYAQATEVRVTLACESLCCVLEIEDNGVGFRADRVRTEAHGLFGMRHRVEARQGEFRIHSHLGAGTRISVTLPALSAATVSQPHRTALLVTKELGTARI